MKKALATALFLAIGGVPAFAQMAPAEPQGYVSAAAGPVWSGGDSTGSFSLEGGVRVAPHTMVFGSLGRFSNLQTGLDATLASATTAAANAGVGVNATGTLASWYGLGGVRVEAPVNARFAPYALGGVGAAHLSPTTELGYASGALPDGSTPAIGTDVSASLEASGVVTPPTASTAFTFMLGGGVDVSVAPHVAIDVGYRYSRINADPTLSSSPLNTSAIAFGVGYRF